MQVPAIQANRNYNTVEGPYIYIYLVSIHNHYAEFCDDCSLDLFIVLPSMNVFLNNMLFSFICFDIHIQCYAIFIFLWDFLICSFISLF